MQTSARIQASEFYWFIISKHTTFGFEKTGGMEKFYTLLGLQQGLFNSFFEILKIVYAITIAPISPPLSPSPQPCLPTVNRHTVVHVHG